MFLVFVGKTPYKAFSEWFASNGTRGTYVEEPLDRPECNPSCCSELCLKCRKPKPTVAKENHDPTEVVFGSGEQEIVYLKNLSTPQQLDL